MINLTQLKQNLSTALDGIVSSDEIEDLMLTVASLDSLSTDRVSFVSTVDDLPEANAVPQGTVFYVSSIRVMVFSVYWYWLGFDGRLLRVDAPEAKLLSWGSNSSGQLGSGIGGFATGDNKPREVVGGITNWSQVSAGNIHSLSVTDTGIAYAWGSGGQGQLGDEAGGFSNTKSSPVTVVGGITNWSQVSAGGQHSLGVTATGIAYAWGSGGQGQLGDEAGGFSNTKSSPVTVVGGITNWSQVSAGASAGFQHSLGLTADGIAYAWGSGGQGRLGDGTTINKSSPVTVVGGVTNWSQVSAGGSHSLGVTDTGIAYAWGSGSSGQLGDEAGGFSNIKSSPVTVVGGITNWSQVSAGSYHSLGVTATGIAYAWGSGSFGRLGDGTGIDKSSPVTVVGGITNWSQVSAGGSHSLGVTDTGIAYAWGSGSQGLLGDGTTVNKSSPVTVVGGITNWSQVSAGGSHSLGVRS